MQKPRIHFDNYLEHQTAVLNMNWTVSECQAFWRKTLGLEKEDGFHHGLANVQETVVDVSIAQTMMQNCYSFVDSGCQVFNMGQVVCEQYLNTGLEGVTSEDLVMPYDCFYMAIPPGLLRCWNWETGYHDAWGIYVRWPNYQEKRLVDLAITLQAGPNENSISFSDDAIHWAGLKFKEIDAKGVEKSIGDLMMTSVGAQIPETAGVDDIYRRIKRTELGDVMTKATRLVVNLLCDLDRAGADIVEDEVQKKRRKKRLRLEEGLERYAPVKKRKELDKATKISISSLWRVGAELETAFKRRNPNEGFWVKGHRQVYWTGAGRLIRTLLYKRPRWQTGDDGEQPDLNSGNTYEIVE